MQDVKPPGFFSHYPHGLLVQRLVDEKEVECAFCRAEEGDFALNLLVEDPDELHIADSDLQSLMTTQVKIDHLGETLWDETQECFCRPEVHTRLMNSGRWDKDNFLHHTKRDSHTRYLRDLPTFHNLKMRLPEMIVHDCSFFETLASFVPERFDLLYLGRLLDEPAMYKEHDWPKLIQSRLTPDGRIVVLTDQDELFMEDRLKTCGFLISDRYDLDPKISTLIFTKN